MSKDFISNYLRDLQKAIEGIRRDSFDELINSVIDCYEREAKIFVMGNGGSAATASHLSCDINKGVSFGLKKKFKMICLNDNIPTMLAYANDLTYEDIFVEQIKNFLEPSDLVIGISASGNSKNVLKAIEYANKVGCETLALTGFNGGKLSSLAKKSLIVRSDDMQKIEDAHLIITHIIMQTVYKKLHKVKK